MAQCTWAERIGGAGGRRGRPDELAVCSEVQRDAAHHAFGRTQDEELVVQGLLGYGIAEEVSNREEHLPFRAAEVHERQRLTNLDVEPAVDRTAVGRPRLHP